MDITIIIISIVIAIASMVFGGLYWKKFKNVIAQTKVILDLILSAVEDDQITRPELDMIIKEAKALFSLFTNKGVDELHIS